MANLETLFIEVSGNAEKAKGGIDSLITSLSSLGAKVDEICGKFKELNSSIQAMSHVKQIKLPSVPTVTQEAEKVTSNINNKYVEGMTTSKPEFQRIKESADKASTSISNVKGKLAEVAKEVEKTSSTVKKHSSGLLSSIGRIAKTLLIRTALKSIMKAFSEAWTAAYNFSKKVGGEFASNIEKLRGAISGTAIKLVSTFAPALNAIVPVVNVVANAIAYLCNLLQQLMSVLGFTSELFGASAKDINDYSKSASGGGSATKGMLAAFDELNVIQSQKGGGGGGGSNAMDFSYLTDAVSDEMARLQVIVGESMIAIGLILAFTGHVPLGVGMIAIGAAAIVKTLVNDWGKLTQDTKDQIATIMAIAAGASLALGLILCLAGHLGMGIGLILLGVANMAGIVSIKDSLSPEIKKQLSNIALIVGKSLLALGAILCLTGAGVGIGLALLLAGGVSLATGVALDNTLLTKVTLTWTLIKSVVTNVWNSIKKTVETAWETMKSVFYFAWSKVEGKWENIVTQYELIWGAISIVVKRAWKDMETVFNFTWGTVSRTWENIKENFCKKWELMKESIEAAWKTVEKWINIKWTTFELTWSSIKLSFSSTWKSISESVTDAWNIIKQVWDLTIYSKIKAAWKNVKSIFEPIETVVKAIETALRFITGTHKVTIKQSVVQTVTTVTKSTKKGTIENEAAGAAVSVAKNSDDIFVQAAGSILGWLTGYANGAYNIPSGDLFIANEAGAELVGSLNGKTTVANQGQIIEGIRLGVKDANDEQNALLRQQNELLRGILEKEFKIGASVGFGRLAKQSLDMYGSAIGG